MRLPNGFGTVYKQKGNRRNPYVVRKTIGWELNEETGKARQKYLTIGYAATKAKGLEMLMEYNKNPYDIESSRITFAEVYEKWFAEKLPTIQRKNANGYKAAFRDCEVLHKMIFKDIKLGELQGVLDNCEKNYSSINRIKILYNQLYEYAMKFEICSKDYSKFVDVRKFKDRNPNKIERVPFSEEEINRLWEQSDNPYIQIILMLIYSGVRVSELLDLKCENVHLDEHYFKIIESKTENGIRDVPIHDRIYPFFQQWYHEENEYLLFSTKFKHIQYRTYTRVYWYPALELIGAEHKPHDTRHTCISMMTAKEINPTFIKKIVGHAGAMSLTERVYTHISIEDLLAAINKI